MNQMSFRILYQDEYYVAIDKPAGFHVHPPEDLQHRISKRMNCLSLLRDQLGQFVYPVHRLDRATSGVLIFGLSSEGARRLSEAFQNHQVRKIYYCVTRGWISESGLIARPLKVHHDPSLLQESSTLFHRVAQCELDIPVGPYPKARYSLVQAQPLSGRRHQIRRHLAGEAHPLVGDTVYGRTEHNTLFKNHLKIPGLLLKAYALEFDHPFAPGENQRVRIRSRWDRKWHQVFDLFQQCPWSGGQPDPNSP